jgi:hypothetical protein
MEARGQFHTPTALSHGKQPPVPVGKEAGRAPEPVWTLRNRRKVSCPCQKSNPSHPVCTRLTHYQEHSKQSILGTSPVIALWLELTYKTSRTSHGLMANSQQGHVTILFQIYMYRQRCKHIILVFTSLFMNLEIWKNLCGHLLQSANSVHDYLLY